MISVVSPAIPHRSCRIYIIDVSSIPSTSGVHRRTPSVGDALNTTFSFGSTSTSSERHSPSFNPKCLAYPALTLLITLAAAGDIDANDLPSECKEVCSPVVSLTASCDSKTSDDDTAELSCICKGKNAASILPMCDACITKYSQDGSDNGMLVLISLDSTSITYSKRC